MSTFSFSDLQGKVCAITGGAGIIGEAMSSALASCGCHVAIIDLSKDAAVTTAERVSASTGTRCIGVEGNVLKKETLEAAKLEINEALGKINILINCAGGNSPKATTQVEELTEESKSTLEKSFYGLDIEAFKFVFDLNFIGTVLPTMVFTKDMLELNSGAVLNISSMNAFRPLTKIPAYSAAKAGINNLTEWLAVHFAKIGIRVNGIAPGFFLTNQNRFLLVDEKSGELTPRARKIINGTPMGKFGAPDDLQGTTLFLVSDLAKFITGVTIPVDGGFNAYSGV